MINERGSVLPITLIIILIAIFAVGQAAFSYVSQYHYISEIKQFYKKEIHQQLIAEKRPANEPLESGMFENSHLAPESEDEMISGLNHQHGGSKLLIESERKKERQLSDP